MNPKVAVILVNLNQETYTRECIRSLLNISYDNAEIILIDNGSTDGSGEQLHEEFSSVVYHRNPENLGFCIGNNIGIRIALERKAEYIMLLNNDTVVDKNFIQPLIELAASDNTVGVQSCKIYFLAEPEKLWYAGGVLDVDRALAHHRGMYQLDTTQYDEIQEVEFATGCMMFLKRSVAERVGPFDETLFAYFEDSDWCVRARNCGYRIVYNPRARVWYKVLVTNTIDSPFYLYFTMRNKIVFLRKHSRPGKWLWHLPYLVLYYVRQILRAILKRRSYTCTCAVIVGIVDGLRNYTGERGKGSLMKLM